MHESRCEKESKSSVQKVILRTWILKIDTIVGEAFHKDTFTFPLVKKRDKETLITWESKFSQTIVERARSNSRLSFALGEVI